MLRLIDTMDGPVIEMFNFDPNDNSTKETFDDENNPENALIRELEYPRTSLHSVDRGAVHEFCFKDYHKSNLVAKVVDFGNLDLWMIEFP